MRVHIGTAEVLGRVSVINDAGEIEQGSTDLAQFRLESPVVAVPGERFIIRSYSPQATIAGGAVTDNSPKKHRKRDLDGAREYLNERMAAAGTPKDTARLIVDSSGRAGTRRAELAARTGWNAETLKARRRDKRCRRYFDRPRYLSCLRAAAIKAVRNITRVIRFPKAFRVKNCVTACSHGSG